MVVADRGGGVGAQVAIGASSLSRRVMGGCVAWLLAGVRGVGCRRWEGCQELD